MDPFVESDMDIERIWKGFRVDSCMESYMDSEWTQNGFIRGLIIDSELIPTWIHTQAHNGLIHGFIHGFRMKSGKSC